MRIVLAVLVAAVGVATFAGSGQAVPAAPDRPAIVSDDAVFAAGCPAGWQWQPGHYGRWSEWQHGYCSPARG